MPLTQSPQAWKCYKDENVLVVPCYNAMSTNEKGGLRSSDQHYKDRTSRIPDLESPHRCEQQQQGEDSKKAESVRPTGQTGTKTENPTMTRNTLLVRIAP